MLTIKNRLCNLRFGGSNHYEHSYGRANFRNPLVSSFNLFDSFNLFKSLVLLLLIAVGCTPAGPKALIQGENLVEKGRYLEAIQKLKLATTVTPTNAQAWNYLALAYHYCRQPDQAEMTYRRALLINHDLSEAHYNLGCLYLEQRKNDAAKTEFIAYTLRRVNSIDGLLKLGTAQLRLAELTAAEKTFQDALRLSPQNAEALNGLGCIRAHQRGRATEAAGYFRAALNAQTNYSPALLNWAIVAHQQSQDKRFALQKYREYISLKPPPENVQAVKSAALELEKELNPAPPAAANRVQFNTNFVGQRPAPTNVNHPATAQKSDSAVNPPPKGPPNPSLKLATNKSQPIINQQPPANTDVVKLAAEPVVKPAQDVSSLPAPNAQPAARGNSSIETASASSIARVQAEQLFAEGHRAQQAHRFSDAIKSYRAATQQDPTYFEAFYNLGLALGESGDATAATSAYENALAVRPDSLDARYNLALLLKQRGDFTRAATEFESLLEKYPGDTRSHLSLGNLYAQQLHEPAKARQHYLKVLETDPHNSQASSIRFWLTSNP
jgi:Flp pilus assembly protein TadD